MVKKINFDFLKKKPSMDQILLASMVINPLGGALALGANEIKKNPSGFKSTLKDIGSEVKKDIPIVLSTLGTIGGNAINKVDGFFNKLFLPLMIGGAIVLVVLLKK